MVLREKISVVTHANIKVQFYAKGVITMSLSESSCHSSAIFVHSSCLGFSDYDTSNDNTAATNKQIYLTNKFSLKSSSNQQPISDCQSTHLCLSKSFQKTSRVFLPDKRNLNEKKED